MILCSFFRLQHCVSDAQIAFSTAGIASDRKERREIIDLTTSFASVTSTGRKPLGIENRKMSCQGHFDILILFASMGHFAGTGHFDDVVLGDIFGGKTVTHRYLVLYCFASETTVAIALMTGLLWAFMCFVLVAIMFLETFDGKETSKCSIEGATAMIITLTTVNITAWHIAVHQAI